LLHDVIAALDLSFADIVVAVDEFTGAVKTLGNHFLSLKGRGEPMHDDSRKVQKDFRRGLSRPMLSVLEKIRTSGKISYILAANDMTLAESNAISLSLDLPHVTRIQDEYKLLTPEYISSFMTTHFTVQSSDLSTVDWRMLARPRIFTRFLDALLDAKFSSLEPSDRIRLAFGEVTTYYVRSFSREIGSTVSRKTLAQVFFHAASQQQIQVDKLGGQLAEELQILRCYCRKSSTSRSGVSFDVPDPLMVQAIRNTLDSEGGPPVNILSLDGGGVRGIGHLVFLAELESRVGVPVRDMFDLIAGTSVGGLVALGLMVGIAASDLLTWFEKNVADIFGTKNFLGAGQFALGKGKFSSGPLFKTYEKRQERNLPSRCLHWRQVALRLKFVADFCICSGCGNRNRTQRPCNFSKASSTEAWT
jgi:hypothetical protein